MIDFGPFLFGSTTAVGGHAFAFACVESGLKPTGAGRILDPPTLPHDKFRVTIVRHPFTWLKAYYESVPRPEKIGVKEIDVFAEMYGRVSCFGNFVELCVKERPGAIGRMFDAYQANSMLRYEDMPRAGVEILESFGVQNLKPIAALPPPQTDSWMEYRDLRVSVVKAERDFCDRAEYF